MTESISNETIRNYLKDKKFLANDLKSLWVVLTTIVCHGFILWTYFGLHSSILFVLTYPLILLRWFMIYHDCIHLSFWENKKWCIRFGELLTIWTFTPYRYWRTNHILHHDNSGDRTTQKYDFNDTIFFTVHEYEQLSVWKRCLYRFVRDPFIFFTLIPIIKFCIVDRFRKKCLLTNIGIGIRCSILFYFGGIHFLLLVIISFMIASTGSFVLFHLQHTYNPTYVNQIPGQYSKMNSALQGSSCIMIPPVLKWFTLGIEYHHIHHLATQIPGYNLQSVYTNAPSTFWDEVFKFDSFEKIIDSLGKTLWDEQKHRFVSFSELDK